MLQKKRKKKKWVEDEILSGYKSDKSAVIHDGTGYFLYVSAFMWIFTWETEWFLFVTLLVCPAGAANANQSARRSISLSGYFNKTWYGQPINRFGTVRWSRTLTTISHLTLRGVKFLNAIAHGMITGDRSLGCYRSLRSANSFKVAVAGGFII